MGERGPAPIPTALKIAAGNPGRRELNDDEPVPPPGQVEPPFVLTDDGLAVWKVAAPVAAAMKTLTTADVLTFAVFCEAYGRWMRLRDICAKGTTYTRTDEKGRIIYVGEIPQAAEMRKLYDTILKYASHFGMTAAARSRIRVQLAGSSSDPAAESEADRKRREFFRRSAL